MSDYLKKIKAGAKRIDYESDNPEKLLASFVERFRPFDSALDEFIANHGFTGDISDIDSKKEFIRKRFESAGIDYDKRTINGWYERHVSAQKDFAIKLCFAFGLHSEEAEEFFRCVCLCRGFDLHEAKELIYYVALRNGIPYKEASAVVAETDRKLDELYNRTLDKNKRIVNGDVVFTSVIIRETESFTTLAETQAYIMDNTDSFIYNNARATESIRLLWKEAEKLTVIEADRLAVNYTVPDGSDEKDKDNGIPGSEEEKPKEKKEKKHTRHTEGNPDDLVLNRIIGYDDEMMRHMAESGGVKSASDNRSLKPVLKDNPVIHRLVENNFPDRLSIGEIVRGNKNKDDEKVRKILIMLKFYSFWIHKALEADDLYFTADEDDCKEAENSINFVLAEAHFPELYLGNPYDWMFLQSSEYDNPLASFREFMAAAYNAKIPDLIRD